MSDNLLQLYTTQFTANLQLLLQQKQSLVSPWIMRGPHVGKMASPVNQVGVVQMKAPSGRFSPLNRQDPDMVRRWVLPIDKEASILIDNFDKLKTIVDPQSAEVQAMASAAAREMDDRVLAAFFADAYIGVDESALTTESFDTTNFRVSQSFGASGNTGLTIAKMIEARRMLRHAHNDLESDTLTMIIGSKQESDLMNQAQVVSSDFNPQPVLVDGRLTRFLGINIVVSERVPWASNVRSVPMFVRSGMHLGVWTDIEIDISQRKDLSSLPWQIYGKMSVGATRLEQGKVIEIQCADTTGNDTTP
jgi:hypothetical protein